MAKKILLADDSLTIQKVVELTFSDSEYDLICVSNGQRALDKVAEHAPDLILADAVMPEKNGYEVCEAIKSNPTTSRIPVILLSGTFEPFDRDRAERLGCDAIVSKPFDSQQLLRQVEALLSRPAGETPSTATMAIPTMPNPVPPPPAPAASAIRPPAEAGFSSEDFTGAIRTPAAIAGGADMFEEEYGHGDVESAIAAFEKAHPEFAHVEESEASSAMTPEPGPRNGDGMADDETTGEWAVADEGAGARHGLAEWLREEPAATESAAPPPPPAPAPFWVPREPEPDLQPIPFAADDSMARRPAPAPEPMRADEGPTQQIPLSADYASMLRPPAEKETEEEEELEIQPSPLPFPAPPAEERTAEIPIAETRALFAGQAASADEPPAAPEPAPAAPAASEETAPVPREIEELASTTSIGQLKEMLSSVSRGPGGALSDDDIDRLASRVVERLSDKIVREIAWEVIPDVAEIVIKQRIKELESGVE